MTTSRAAEVSRRKRPRPTHVRRNMLADALLLFRETRAKAHTIRWPSARYRADPVRFAHDILGFKPWSRQVDILEAVRDHESVAVSSGHKTGKSASAAILALWFYCSFEDARVVMSSTTSRQVDRILWRELRMMVGRGGRCLACKAKDPHGDTIPAPCPHSTLIDGELGELARTGLKSEDFREVVGFTAREAEAVAGISGANLMYLIDEASGVPEIIYEAIEGNRMGGARLVLFSNPTRNEGTFFDAFHGASDFYKTLTISSEETPNYIAGERLIPGLAERSRIELKKEEWGADSALYKVRILGQFALAEEGKIFSIHAITEAEARWAETPAEGRLWIGIDPAGESGTGDEAAFAARRGQKLLELTTMKGLSPEAHLVHLLALVDRLKERREQPVVVLDGEGAVGARVLGAFQTYLDRERRPAFELEVVRASDGAVRQPNVFDRMRDELTANLEGWLRDGGAILEDAKLEKEMHAFEWEQQAKNGKLKVVPPKKQLRKKEHLGRSPDRYDAVALACWEPLRLQDGVPESALPRNEPADDYAEVTLDPYAGLDAWRPR